MGITNSFKKNLIIFLTLVFISYVVDITRNKCSNLTFNAKINNLIHHFLSMYLWFGSVVFGYHEFHILYMLAGSLGWYLFDGECAMTIEYNKICNYEKHTRHYDLIYALSNYETNFTQLTIGRIVFIYDILYLIRKYCF